MSLMISLEVMKKKVRWKGWAQAKVPLYLTLILYLSLKKSEFSAESVQTACLYIVFMVLVLVYGYLINDLFDMKIDKIHGKENAFEKAGRGIGFMTTLALLSVGILAGARLSDKPYFLLLMLILYFFATFYSAPPIRFKERGLAGLVVSCMSQFGIPVIMIFSIFHHLGTVDMWLLTLCSVVVGTSQEIGHQRFDLERDMSTGTGTFGVREGRRRMDRMYGLFIVLDGLSMLVMLIIMAVYLKEVTVYGLGMVVMPPLLIYLVLLGLTMRKMRHGAGLLDPYYVEGRNDVVNMTYTLFPGVFLPLYMSCVAFAKDPIYVVFVALILSLSMMSFPRANLRRQFEILLVEVGRARSRDRTSAPGTAKDPS
jgi:4-hydroxybenzoate polyprenyltransferase